MNSAKTAVICDSGCDVSEALAREYDISIISLIVNYRHRSVEDMTLLKEDPTYVYKHFEQEIPKTSALNIQDVLDRMNRLREEGYENFIAVSISSAMSSTCSVMSCACREYAEEHPESRTFAFDTKNISIGAGAFAIWAGFMLKNGCSFDEVTAKLPEKIHDSDLKFYMDTLLYLRKGGRITPAVELAGRILHIKPVITCNEEGKYRVAAKFRGSAHCAEKLVDLVMPENPDPYKTWFMIMNGDAQDLAKNARMVILSRCPEAKIIEDHQIAPTMAINTGPGLLGICCFNV